MRDSDNNGSSGRVNKTGSAVCAARLLCQEIPGAGHVAQVVDAEEYQQEISYDEEAQYNNEYAPGFPFVKNGHFFAVAA